MPARRELSTRRLGLIAVAPRRGERPRDWAASWRGALDDPGQSEAGGGGRADLPLADDVTDEALERQLFGRARVTQGQRQRVERTGRPWHAS